MSLMKKQLLQPEMGWALERFFIMRMENMHFTSELIEYILKTLNCWGNIYTIIL